MKIRLYIKRLSLIPLITPLVLFSSFNANAQQQVDPNQEIEEVVTIGSRTKGRSAADLPVPVDVLNAEDIARTGQTEVGRILQSLAPSFNFSSSSVSDGTDALRPATLRGLGPDQTLVLINGKRRHQAALIHINTSVGRGTAGTDMNAIPVAAIKRIEVLRDGAAAQYGSDAIAGVINIVLKDSADAGSISASYGEYSEGDGETTNIDMNKGFALGDTGFVNVSVNLRDRDSTNRANPQGGCLYGNCTDSDNNGFSEPAMGNESLEVSGPGRDGFRIGDAESEQLAIVLNGAFQIGLGEIYSFITYSKRDNESGAFYRNPTGSNGVGSPGDTPDGDGVIQGNALLRDGLNPANTNGFLPIIQSDIEDFSFNIGYQIELDNGASFDISYTSGENTIDYTTQNSANYSYANFLQFGEGLSDDEIRAQIPREAFAYGLELELETFDFGYTQTFGDLSLAAGIQLRTDNYKIIPGAKYSYFDYDTDPATSASLYAQNAGGSIQGFNGVSPESATDEDRDVASFYVDGEYQVSEQWLISTAVRLDDYDGFGDTTNFKLASSFAVTDNFTVRGAISTGFRAPSMQQLYFNNISTQIRDAGAITVGTFRNDSDVVQAIGVPELKEEESENWSIGFVADITHNWSVTVDYYSIDIDDRIAISNQLGAGDDPIDSITGPLATALSDSGAGAAQFFLNGANTETTGFDIVSTYNDIELGNGLLDITFAANFTETDVTDVFVPSSGALGTIDPSVVFSTQDISIVEEWQPEDRMSLTGNYIAGDLMVTLSINRFGEYTILDSTEQTYSAEVLTDLRISYQLNDNTSIFVSGNNIFDVTPDKTDNTGSRGGSFESTAGAEDLASNTVFQYSRRSAPFGFNGAFFSAGVSYTF